MYAEVVGQNELPNGTTVDPHVAEPLSPMKGTIMKALVLTGVKEFEIQDLPTPRDPAERGAHQHRIRGRVRHGP